MSNVDASANTYVSSSEAAFIAGVTDREVHRVIDERIVPDALVRKDDGRRLARLAGMYIAFYFGTEALLTASARREVLSVLTHELRSRTSWHEALRLESGAFDELRPWLSDFHTEEAPYLHLDLLPFLQTVQRRAKAIDHAMRHIASDTSTMGGTPVFRGTRVPVESVVSSLDAGVPMARLQASYPFLTEELAEAGRIYLKVRPRRGRPRRLAEDLPEGWEVRQTKVVKPSRT